MTTILNYMQVVLPVMAGIIAIAMYIKASKRLYNTEYFVYETTKKPKWSMQWFDVANIVIYLAFIVFMNTGFMTYLHANSDMLLRVVLNVFTLLLLYLHSITFTDSLATDIHIKRKAIKLCSN